LATVNETLFFEYTEHRALSRRLRRLAPQAAAALRDLFRARDYLVLEGNPETTWRFGPAPDISPPAAILDGVHEQLTMSITDDGWCEHLGARAWWDFTADSRLLAWALAHSGLLEGLGRILREPLIPSALTAGPLTPSDTNVALSFSVSTPDGRTTTGCVSLSAQMVTRLVSHSGWRLAAAIAPEWLKLPATVRVELPGAAFATGELSASQIGDVLILGNQASCWRKLHVTLVGAHGDKQMRTWNVCYDGTRLTVSAGVLNSPTELIMSDPKATGAVDNIPVSLDFDLGSLELPLGELAALKPGYVFELAGSLEKLRVVIRANGTRVGVGELVAVGEVLGVQLLALEIDGLR
jgi:type III secretion system YscQ/HrcQ family protein